jgi:hypothetical protein
MVPRHRWGSSRRTRRRCREGNEVASRGSSASRTTSRAVEPIALLGVTEQLTFDNTNGAGRYEMRLASPVKLVPPRAELAWRGRSPHGAGAAHRARLGNGFEHPMRREVHGVLIRAPGRLRRPCRTRVGGGAVS